VGRTANLCVADDIRRDLALFGGHVVNTIVSSVWIKVKLTYPSPPIRYVCVVCVYCVLYEFVLFVNFGSDEW
jgi:hypothetical protein